MIGGYFLVIGILGISVCIFFFVKKRKKRILAQKAIEALELEKQRILDRLIQRKKNFFDFIEVNKDNCFTTETLSIFSEIDDTISLIEKTRKEVEVELGKMSFTHVSIRKGLAPGDKIALNRPDINPTAIEKKE